MNLGGRNSSKHGDRASPMAELLQHQLHEALQEHALPVLGIAKFGQAGLHRCTRAGDRGCSRPVAHSSSDSPALAPSPACRQGSSASGYAQASHLPQKPGQWAAQPSYSCACLSGSRLWAARLEQSVSRWLDIFAHYRWTAGARSSPQLS